MIAQYIFQFKQLERRSLKNQGFNRIQTRDLHKYQCDALPTELHVWSRTLGARSIYWVHIFPCSEVMNIRHWTKSPKGQTHRSWYHAQWKMLCLRIALYCLRVLLLQVFQKSQSEKMLFLFVQLKLQEHCVATLEYWEQEWSQPSEKETASWGNHNYYNFIINGWLKLDYSQ